MVEMALDGGGICYTAHVLGISPTTVITILKKKAPMLQPVNSSLVIAREGSLPAVMVRKVQEVELDEMCSFVGRKRQPRWLWEALDHQTGRVVK
jgi:insertion element IS1 protein InsB